MAPLHDIHCHLSFMENGADVAADAQAAGTLLFANTVTPEEWAQACRRFAQCGNVTVGFGMHPWWVAGDPANGAPGDGEAQPQGESQRARRRKALENTWDQAEARAGDDTRAKAQRLEVLGLLEEHDPPALGEVGLDFGWSHVSTGGQQLLMFRAVATWAARRGGKLMSIHAVRAAQEAFDVLAQAGALESCTCIFHWFTGPSDLLKRAVQAGCLFSCGPRMLATAKGREYVKAIPSNRLLLETDAPPTQGMPYSYAELCAELEAAANAIASLKGADTLEKIAATSAALLA